jgi:hypothetical protein
MLGGVEPANLMPAWWKYQRLPDGGRAKRKAPGVWRAR